VLVAYVAASAYLGEAQYQSAIDALRRAYPNDASLDLMLLDGYFMKKRYDEALQAVDRIDRSLGGDPYLDVMRANMLLAKGDVDGAYRFATRAVEREPSLSEAQLVLDDIAKRRSER
jgi:predicted Zn-dependent protease